MTSIVDRLVAARRCSGVSIVTVFVVIAGCGEDGRQKHPHLTPQLTATISNLRQAADTLTGYGDFAKKIRRNAEGQALFTKAIACHNACLSYIGTGLDAGFAEADIRSRLQQADATRTNLMDWCKDHARRRDPIEPQHGPAVCESYAVPELAADFLVRSLHELLEYDCQLRKLEQQERAAQIERIKQELKACECRQWSQL